MCLSRQDSAVSCDGFEKQFLARSGEPKSLARLELVSYLAQCHMEFILIHPFKESNGRLSRLHLRCAVGYGGEGFTGLQPVG